MWFQFDVDEFVASHLNDHRKGLLGRQMSAEALLTFSKAVLCFITVHISVGGNAIASVRPSVHLFVSPLSLEPTDR